MALVKCHECENEVSTEARRCPKCGAKNKKFEQSKIIMFGGGFLLLVVLLAVYETYAPDLESGVPVCDSERGVKIFIDAFDKSPFALENHLRAIDIRSHKDISKSEKPEDRMCEITFRLSNAENMTYVFTFEDNEDGRHFVHGKQK